MRAVTPVDRRSPESAEIRLVDEGRGLKSVIPALGPEDPRGYSLQIGIQGAHQLLGSRGVALARFHEHRGYSLPIVLVQLRDPSVVEGVT
jgi:hypothetical protein